MKTVKREIIKFNYSMTQDRNNLPILFYDMDDNEIKAGDRITIELPSDAPFYKGGIVRNNPLRVETFNMVLYEYNYYLIL